MHTLDDILGLEGEKEPLANWTWRVLDFPAFGSLRLDSRLVKSTSLPMPKFAPRSKTLGATTVTSAGMSEVDAFDLVIQESQQLDGLKYIVNWMNNVQNPDTGGYYLPSRYKKNLTIVLYDIKGTPIMNSTLKNVWPTTVGQWELNSESGFRELQVNFSCDANIIEFLV